MNSDLLDLPAAAALLGVSLSTMEEWVRTKAVASFKKGRVRRIAREEIARFVLANTVKAKRADWLTPAIESDFRRVLEDIVAVQVQKFLAEQRPAIAA